MENLIIIGGGPAGNTAAIYAARANLNPIMFEGFYAAWVAAGGQLTTTTEVENYPGFTAIQGPELMLKMREQAIHCGARIETKTVDSVDLTSTPYKVVVGGQVIETKSVIISTGATAKRMGVPGESEYRQRGVSACAVCDGALPMYRNKTLVVVGGWDTACEEALYLTKFASKIIMLVRRDAMRASKAMQDRAMKHEKIEIMRNTKLLSINGGGEGTLMSGATIENIQTSEQTQIEAAGLFYAIGHTPNTGIFADQLQLDEAGYIMTQPGSTKVFVAHSEKSLHSVSSNLLVTHKVLPGVFAAGDVQDHVYRQAITSAGTGCMAALDAERWLAEQE
jgi:thioredoxin reductase (NADPH)